MLSDYPVMRLFMASRFFTILIMERLDQGHLHPLLEHPRQTCPGRGLNLRHPALQTATLAKSYRDSLMLLIRKLYTNIKLSFLSSSHIRVATVVHVMSSVLQSYLEVFFTVTFNKVAKSIRCPNNIIHLYEECPGSKSYIRTMRKNLKYTGFLA
jgi:hypothetical protein